MTTWAPLIAPIIAAVAGLITALCGAVTLVIVFKRGSQRERVDAADRVADKLLNPGQPDQTAIQAAIEDYMEHHPERHEEGNR